MTEREKVLLAFKAGYRVTEDGQLIGRKGKPLSIKETPSGYPTFTPYVRANTSNGCVTIQVHRFAAYCFYGEELYTSGLIVRHLDDNKTNVAKSNIVLGTYADNEADKGAYKRHVAARKREREKRLRRNGSTT